MSRAKRKPTGGPSRPLLEPSIAGVPGRFFCGTTVRDEAAFRALQGMLASAPLTDRTKVDKRKWARIAYEFADAMVEERARS